jgi:hypothetical protein
MRFAAGQWGRGSTALDEFAADGRTELAYLRRDGRRGRQARRQATAGAAGRAAPCCTAGRPQAAELNSPKSAAAALGVHEGASQEKPAIVQKVT